MAYIISEDTKEFIKDVKNFCESDLFKEQVKMADETGEYPEALYAQAVEMGLAMLDVPEEFGGLEMSTIDHAAVIEEIAKADAGVAVTLNCNGLALKPILISGTQEQKEKYCELVLNGGWGAFALTEPDAGCDAGNSKTTAVKDGNEWVINGSKCFITNAQNADFFVVMAMTNKEFGTKGMSAFIVDRETPGLKVGKHEDKMGIRTSVTSDVIFDNVRVPESAMLGTEGSGFITAMKTLDLARTWCAVIAVGICQRCVDEAVNYSKQRVQFGKPICKNQAIQFKIADMEIRTETSRQMVAHAITLQDMHANYSKESAIAKTVSGDAAVQNAIEAIQIHGGYGYSREYPVEKLLRDSKIFQIFEGTNEIQRMVIGRSVIGK